MLWMDKEKIPPIPPETDGWDEEAKENPRIVRIHRLFIAACVFFALVFVTIAA